MVGSRLITRGLGCSWMAFETMNAFWLIMLSFRLIMVGFRLIMSGFRLKTLLFVPTSGFTFMIFNLFGNNAWVYDNNTFFL